MDTDLRDAIRADPRDRARRWALAEHLGDCPEAALIQLLMQRPGYHSIIAITGWFEQHQVLSPQVESRSDHGDVERRDFATSFVGWAFNPDRWPDRVAWHAGVVALARRMLPNARSHLPIHDRHRTRLEEVAASEPVAAPRPMPEYSSGSLAEAIAEGRGRAEYSLALGALHAGRWVASRIYGGPGDSPGDAASYELEEQYHVLGWSWLGLPPLRPEADSSAPVDWMPDAPARPWTMADLPAPIDDRGEAAITVLGPVIDPAATLKEAFECLRVSFGWLLIEAGLGGIASLWLVFSLPVTGGWHLALTFLAMLLCVASFMLVWVYFNGMMLWAKGKGYHLLLGLCLGLLGPLGLPILALLPDRFSQDWQGAGKKIGILDDLL